MEMVSAELRMKNRPGLFGSGKFFAAGIRSYPKSVSAAFAEKFKMIVLPLRLIISTIGT